MKKYLEKLIVASVLLSGLSLHADIPEPFASVRTLPQTPYFVQDGYTYYNLINTHTAAVVVDVESQDGGVARYIAQQVATLPSVTKIYSVNSWQSPDLSQKNLFQHFLSNVVQENTAALITPIRMTSQEAAQSLNIKADFVSLVGGNNQQKIYNDILAWYPHLSNTGIICGNNWYDSSVQEGVTKAAATLDLTLQVNSNVWYFVKGS